MQFRILSALDLYPKNSVSGGPTMNMRWDLERHQIQLRHISLNDGFGGHQHISNPLLSSTLCTYTMSSSIPSNPPLIHIIRHGEALHNVQRGHPHRDPPLTEQGNNATKGIKLTTTPDLILISPMTRTLQTAMNVFPHLKGPEPSHIPVQIWPDLREGYDVECNKGLPRADIEAKFPQFDFSECHERWDYPEHTIEDATARAERVRSRLKGLSEQYKNIAVVTHRGFIAFLAKGRRFDVCERRSFRFATEKEAQDDGVRRGTNCDTLEDQDFGPTVLILHKKRQDWEMVRDNF
jgi:broad specificity phosphatase PhoE